MAIQLYVSNALPKLAKQLAIDLKENHNGVFAQQQIVTQTDGMNNWLKIKLAEHLGIAANCAFKKPNDLVSLIYFWLGGYDKPVISSDYIKWSVYHLLNDADFIKQFPFIAVYYKNHDIKRIALASKVADLFDQYQVYRPEIITAWKETKKMSDIQEWQHYIWLKIYQDSKGVMLDKTDAIHAIIQFLAQPDKLKILKSKLPHVHFFGIAVITPAYLRLFYELSKHISIQFYLLNPAPASYWLEDHSEKEIARIVQKSKRKGPAGNFAMVGNELLNSWGTIIKESFSLLFEEESYINNYNDSLALEPADPTTLLKKIQHDIYFNAPVESRNQINESDLVDASITVNSCYTIVREVEVLYNYLVNRVEQSSAEYSPRDIVVMVSDINSYAPYIRAVFDNAPYSFPYTIADENLSEGNTFFTSIETILSLHPESFKAEEILQLLESKYIRERFGISDVDLIRKTVDAANIRFGTVGDKNDDTRLLSWQYGLKRIIYGICISGEPILNIDDDILIPLDSIEGTDAQELIRFWHMMQMLEYTIRQRSKPRSIAQWSLYLQELIESLVFQAAETDDEDYHRLISYLEKLTLLEEISNEPIGFDVFKHSFLEILTSETKAMAFAGAGITFCSLIPMRSIPFKVVAMLGMNFDKFPRKENKLSFNLIESQRRKGDRNVKDNDKHLFLETILSAEESFYLSFIGRSAKDGTKIPPSSLVDELVEYIIQGTPNQEDTLKSKIITTHPLHGFSQRYFNGSGLVSYLSDDKYTATTNITSSKNDAPDFDFSEINTDQLLKFIKNPIKWYFNKGLGVYYRDEKHLLPDTEIFELDFLSNWKLKDDLLQMPESSYRTYFERLHLMGFLPLKNSGELEFEKAIESTMPKIQQIKDVSQGLEHKPIAVNLTIGGSLITGTINSVYGNRLIAISDSKNKNKYIIQAYVSFLLAHAQGFNIDLYYLDFKFSKVTQSLPNCISQADAITQLEKIVEYYRSGFKEPFLFYPDFPLEIFEKDALDFIGAIEKMKNDKYIHLFEDDYISKSYYLDFFSEENFEAIRTNTKLIIDSVNCILPGIIK